MCINTASVPDKIRAVAQAGFEAIEMWHTDLVHYKPSEIKRMLADNNIKLGEIAKMEGWFENDGTLMDTSDVMGECKRRMEFARELDCPYIVALPSRSDRGFYRSWEEGVEAYRKLLEFGEQIGICPTLEFIGQSEQVNSVDKALKFLEDAGGGKTIVDVFHIWRGTGNVDDFERVPLDKISLLHFHDAGSSSPRTEYKDRDRVMPGDGIIDLRRFVEIANGKGFAGMVSLGVYNHANWSRDPYEVAREGMDKMSRYFQSIKISAAGD